MWNFFVTKTPTSNLLCIFKGSSLNDVTAKGFFDFFITVLIINHLWTTLNKITYHFIKKLLTQVWSSKQGKVEKFNTKMKKTPESQIVMKSC